MLAAAPAPRSVDRRVLGALLGDAINPQFADRVAPIVDVMLALTSEPLPEKREVFGIASPESPRPPVDPQAR